MFSDFEKTQARMKRSGDAARMNAGDSLAPKVGGIYTISPSFFNGDRSYTDNFVEVIAVSGPNVLCRIHDSWTDKPRLLSVEERAWYDASEAFAVWQSETKGKT